jgi:RNA polymerase sigma-70 factor, ECF subfamily
LTSIPDQDQLARQIAQGNALAEKQLFDYFGSRIKLLVRARLRGVPADEQKDIISEINHAILTSLRKGGFNSTYGKPLEAYIAGIAGNYVALYYRNLKKKIPLSDLSKFENIESPDNILSGILNKERAEHLRTCINRLDPKYLEILILRFYEDNSIEEIAAKLNIERRRVSERINYAVKLLLKEFKREGYFQ